MARNLTFKDDNGEEIIVDMPEIDSDNDPLLPKPGLKDPQTVIEEDKPKEPEEDDVEAEARRIQESMRKPIHQPKAAPVDDEKIVYQRGMLASQVELADFKLKDLRAQMVAARDEGDTAKELELDDQIQDLRNKRSRYQETLESLPATPEKPQTKQAESGEQPIAREAANWLERNKWYTAPNKTGLELEKAQFALTAFQNLTNGRFRNDAENPELYKEIDRMIGKLYAPEKGTGGAKQPPVQGVQNGAKPSGGNKLKVPGDIRTIAEEGFGMDFKSNPEIALELAKNIEKRRLQRGG